ncbi:hypothetical protein DOM21_11845 [Bacteriovorax stolpii]|uniref:Uncharacterized protein n=1 Tax=Bacteriovorax stolpii TaxID=960 RepID=A0A2K9NQV0_BACTC|nr:hypothetical protein [Bacteriovorax stolpii]AUN97887.1 hypothetical protein C0V70_07155 [Bacteriovorax stolpii]QDK42127.1 hypothetical protein DOM21_11845 [Bacteriovorax stolpii]TDP51718.1 hypothetical protein C8D79_3163 [Bacteriovorax stolpii]
MKILIKSTLFCALLLTSQLQAKTPVASKGVEEYFNVLARDKVDFEPQGMVCERVAVREVESIYPSANYDIINSIRYDDKKTTIGELDVVVIDKNTNQVEAVAEVKCWKSFNGALKKAKEQRMRFLTYLNRSIIIEDKDGKRYSKDQFKRIQKFFTISQAGGMNQGFDFELSLNFKELMELRGRLLDCKAQGRCPQR